MSLKIRKLSYALGAEISGVDTTKPLADETFREIHDTYLGRCILLFRGQPLTRGQFIAFAGRFGELGKRHANTLSDYPEISTVINKPKTDGSPADATFNGSDWHSDSSYRLAPPATTLLRAVEIPPVGGDTQFANMYLAYETLSDGMKKLLDGMEGVHIQEEKDLDHSSPERLEESRRAKTVAQPLVKVHPESGRKSLYVGDKLLLLRGLTREESRPLIDFLREHARRPQFIYRHQWQKDDVIIWDNRCTNHNALGDYDRRNQPRRMEKVFVPGHTTGHLYNDPEQTRNTSSGAVLQF